MRREPPPDRPRAHPPRVRAAFRRMREHLGSRGLVAFETRNPHLDWASAWAYEIEIPLGRDVVLERRRLLAETRPLLEFELEYEFPDVSLRSQSTLRFWSRPEIEEHATSAGLRVVEVLGDWTGGPYLPESSEEMIFILDSA